MTPIEDIRTAIGKTVQWQSQAQGSTTWKQGVAVEIIQPLSTIAYDGLITTNPAISKAAIKFDRTSSQFRVLVMVSRTGKNGKPLQTWWYAPRMTQEFFLVDTES